MELYESLNFKKNPFSTFSAEEEITFTNDIFIAPLFLQSLKEDIANGHSRYILGARGVGKTSLIYQLENHCKENEILSITIDEFEGIPKKNNKSALLKLIIEITLRDFCIAAHKNSYKIKSLDSESKEKLAFIIQIFYKTISKKEYEKLYNSATNYKPKNIIKKIVNLFNKPVNIAISGTIEIISDTIRNALGLPNPNTNKLYKAYIPEFDTKNPEPTAIDSKLKNDFRSLKNILEDLCLIIKKTGFKSTVIFFDKIDEYAALSSNTTFISEFLEETLKETSLFTNENYSLVFSLWDAIKPELASKGVRFDKIKPIDVTWSDKKLLDILDKRLSYFGKSNISHNDLFEDTNTIQQLVHLSSNSPRYMLRLLSVIYDEQNNLNTKGKKLTTEAAEIGFLNYAKSFDFYAVFPGRRGTKDDVLTSVNRLLKVGQKQITTKNYVATYKVSTASSINYIKIQQDYGLIKKTGNISEQAQVYEIKNPVILFLIEKGITEVSA